MFSMRWSAGRWDGFVVDKKLTVNGALVRPVVAHSFLGAVSPVTRFGSVGACKIPAVASWNVLCVHFHIHCTVHA